MRSELVEHMVGQAVSRREGYLKVTGEATYSAEIPLTNMTHAVLVQSTITSPAGVSRSWIAGRQRPSLVYSLSSLIVMLPG